MLRIRSYLIRSQLSLSVRQPTDCLSDIIATAIIVSVTKPLMSPASVAKVFAALTSLVVAFQVALAAGAPWGMLAMGGAFPGQLPAGLRAAAIVQALILILFVLVVAARAQLVLPRWYAASRRLIWAVVAFSAVSVVLNAITPSAVERALWLPVALVLLSCAVLVARSASHG